MFGAEITSTSSFPIIHHSKDASSIFLPAHAREDVQHRTLLFQVWKSETTSVSSKLNMTFAASRCRGRTCSPRPWLSLPSLWHRWYPSITALTNLVCIASRGSLPMVPSSQLVDQIWAVDVFFEVITSALDKFQLAIDTQALGDRGVAHDIRRLTETNICRNDWQEAWPGQVHSSSSPVVHKSTSSHHLWSNLQSPNSNQMLTAEQMEKKERGQRTIWSDEWTQHLEPGPDGESHVLYVETPWSGSVPERKSPSDATPAIFTVTDPARPTFDLVWHKVELSWATRPGNSPDRDQIEISEPLYSRSLNRRLQSQIPKLSSEV